MSNTVFGNIGNAIMLLYPRILSLFASSVGKPRINLHILFSAYDGRERECTEEQSGLHLIPIQQAEAQPVGCVLPRVAD